LPLRPNIAVVSMKSPVAGSDYGAVRGRAKALDQGHGTRTNAGFVGCVRTEKKPQISPLRCAPVEMTNLFEDRTRRFQEK
jgi:hypothetical protein